MDIERFETLTMAYGGDLRRWPAAERAAAEAFRITSPEAAQAALSEAQGLDAALDDWRPQTVTTALRDRVLGGAPQAKAGIKAAPRGLGFWLSGAGFAAAAVAGVIVGVVASSAAVSNARADEVLSATLSNDADTALAPFTVGSGGARST